MTIYISLNEGGKEVADLSSYAIGAFVNEECRGIAEEKVSNDHKYCYLRVRSNAVSGEKVDFKLYKKNEKEECTLTAATPVEFKADSLIGMPSSPLTLSSLMPGDANGDGQVDILDVIAVISLINGSTDETLVREAANINGDEEINILDVIGILEIMNKETTKQDE